MRKSYPFLLTIDGHAERVEVEAASVSDALFLMGVEFGQENPDMTMPVHEFKIRKLWGNP